MTIDIERRVVDVIESQSFVEVCLVKSGPTLNPIMAVVGTDEITDNVGSPREPYMHMKNDNITISLHSHIMHCWIQELRSF